MQPSTTEGPIAYMNGCSKRQMCWMDNARESNVDERQRAKESKCASNQKETNSQSFFSKHFHSLHLYHTLHLSNP
jgi:hypothetical protein